MTDQKLIAGIFNDFLGLYTGKIQTGIRPLIEKYKNHPMLMGLLSNLDEAAKIQAPKAMKEIYSFYVAKESGTSCNGFCIVRGKAPKAKGQKGDLLLLLKEQPGNSQILEIGVICIDGRKYPEEAWIDVTGKLVEL